MSTKSIVQCKLEYHIWEVFAETFPGSLGKFNESPVQLKDIFGADEMQRTLKENCRVPPGLNYPKYSLDEVYRMVDVASFAYSSIGHVVREIQKTGGMWFLPENIYDEKVRQRSVRACVGLAISTEAINRFFGKNLVETYVQGDFIFPRPDAIIPVKDRTLGDSLYLEYEMSHIIY